MQKSEKVERQELGGYDSRLWYLPDLLSKPPVDRDRTMESPLWYVMDRGKVGGPYSDSDLERMSASGTCSAFSKVSQDKRTWNGLTEHLMERQARLNAPP